jgi:hypothetical protein
MMKVTRQLQVGLPPRYLTVILESSCARIFDKCYAPTERHVHRQIHATTSLNLNSSTAPVRARSVAARHHGAASAGGVHRHSAPTQWVADSTGLQELREGASRGLALAQGAHMCTPRPAVMGGHWHVMSRVRQVPVLLSEQEVAEWHVLGTASC